MKKIPLFVVFLHLIFAKRDDKWNDETRSKDYKYTYKNLGCWKDTENRAVPTLEGSTYDLRDPYESRYDAIENCFKNALRRGFSVFAVQNGGMCSANNGESYKRYGLSTSCAKDGKGGLWANQVYNINLQYYIHAGCWKDTTTSALETLEGASPVLDRPYTKRMNAITDCYHAVLYSNVALKTKYTYFAVQNGGRCVVGKTEEYSKYGPSNDCHTNGNGGLLANDVYFLRNLNFELLAEAKTEEEYSRIFSLG